MPDINQVRIDQYKDITQVNTGQSRYLPFGKTIKINFKPDYALSANIEQHIKTTNSNIANKSIRFLDSSMNINTHQETLGLKLSFVINTIMLDDDIEQPQNLKILLQLHSLPYSQQEASFNATDNLLYKSINKLVKIMYDFSLDNKLNIVALHNNAELVTQLLSNNRDGLVQHLNDIIALVYARGKFRGFGHHGQVYSKDKTGQIHIPMFSLNPGELQFNMQVEEQVGTPVLSADNETTQKTLPLSVFQNWMMQKFSTWYTRLEKRLDRKTEKQLTLAEKPNNTMAWLVLILLVALILVIILL